MTKTCNHIDIIRFPSRTDKCSFRNCCHKIFGLKCHRRSGQICQPIEKKFPELFGELDVEQKILNKIGSKPVLLIENASAFIPLIRDTFYGTNLDLIKLTMEKIIKGTRKKFHYIDSITIPNVLKTRGDPVARSYGNNAWSREYDQIINQIRKKIKRSKKKKLIIHVGLNIHEEAGHYAIMIKQKDSIVIFDSMQYTKNNKHDGYYTPVFRQIAEDIFGEQPQISMVPNEYECLQITGGFVEDRKRREPIREFHTRIQDMDSQNHFCYMWAIWYAHSLLLHGQEKTDQIIRGISERCIHPLIVIKKYIWALLFSIYDLDTFKSMFYDIYVQESGQEPRQKDISYLVNFFLVWFRYVWDNLEKPDQNQPSDNSNFYMFSIIDCDLDQFTNMDINDCFEYSISDVTYVLDNFCLLSKKERRTVGEHYRKK